MPPGKENCLKNSCSPSVVFALVGIDLGVCSLEVDRAENAGSAVPRSGEKDHVQVVFLDQPVEVNVGK